MSGAAAGAAAGPVPGVDVVALPARDLAGAVRSYAPRGAAAA